MQTKKNQVSLNQLYRLSLEEPTPRQKLIKEIQEATGRSEAAVRSWIIGRSKPEPVIIKLIAERLNVDEDYLFPDEELAKVSSDD